MAARSSTPDTWANATPVPLDSVLVVKQAVRDLVSQSPGGFAMSESVMMHRASGGAALNIAVLTVSDTRSIETDTSGALIITMAEQAGHRIVSRDIVRDEPESMTALIQSLHARDDLHAVLITGGTG